MNDVIATDVIPACEVVIVEAMAPCNGVQSVAALDGVRGRTARRATAAREDQQKRDDQRAPLRG